MKGIPPLLKHWRKLKPQPLDKQIIAIEGLNNELTGQVCNILSTHFSCYVVPNYLDSFLDMIQRDLNSTEVRRVARGQQNSVEEYTAMKGAVLIVDRSYLTLLQHVSAAFSENRDLETFRELSNEMTVFWLGDSQPISAEGWNFKPVKTEGKKAREIAAEINQFIPQSQPLSK